MADYIKNTEKLTHPPRTRDEALKQQELHRAAIKQRKRKKALFLGVCGLVLLGLVLCIVFLCHSCSVGSEKAKIYGNFEMTETNCVYTFSKDETGSLKLSNGVSYSFTYTLSDGNLKIDYDSDSLSDCEYAVEYTDKGLELIAGKGTATQGVKYTLTRIDE